jgi:hypothetical protein
MTLDSLKGEARGIGQRGRRAAKRVESDSGVKPQSRNQKAQDASEVTLRKYDEATRGAIGKERVRRADREEMLKELKGPERAERGGRYRKELDAGGLVVPLKSLGPPQPDDQAVREKRDVPPTKVPEGVKRRRGRGGDVGNT